MKRLANNRSPRWAFMERFEVPNFENPRLNYMTRWRLIQTPWFGIYLHRFDSPDTPTLHDHPWPFVSFVLRGGYDEQRKYGPDPLVVPVRRMNLKGATDLHYIRRLHRIPTWTLVLVGRRRRTWGYVDRDGTWTPYDEHPRAQEFDKAMAAREWWKAAEL